MKQDNADLVYELSEVICDYLISKDLCQEEGCDECINKYAKIIIDFEEESFDKK